MTTVYFVRHAEPNYGNHDDMSRELSAKGLHDRVLVTAFLRDKQIDAVYSSPFKRAVDTVKDFADKNGYGFCVIDAPVLLESDCKNFCDIIALVSASESLRLKRILLRDNISEDDAKIRIGAQKSDEYYEENSDIIIMNDKDDNLEEETKKLLKFAEES